MLDLIFPSVWQKERAGEEVRSGVAKVSSYYKRGAQGFMAWTETQSEPVAFDSSTPAQNPVSILLDNASKSSQSTGNCAKSSEVSTCAFLFGPPGPPGPPPFFLAQAGPALQQLPAETSASAKESG